jgi:O-methyltransferase
MAMTTLIRSALPLKLWYLNARFRNIYRSLQTFTMIPKDSYVDNLILARRVRDLPGCVVECGVWRGGMSAGIGKVLGTEREYFLFDSFEGLPPAKEIDGKSALDWQKAKDSPWYHDNCTAGPEFAEQAMKVAGIKSFHLKKGWFDQTLPGFKPPAPIALLRLDGDWYDSTMVCLSHLFDFVAPGGLIVLDDYHFWDGCSRALHDFLSRRSAPERIQSIGAVCFLEKKPPADSKKTA